MQHEEWVIYRSKGGWVVTYRSIEEGIAYLRHGEWTDHRSEAQLFDTQRQAIEALLETAQAA